MSNKHEDVFKYRNASIMECWDICDEWTALEFDVLMIKSHIIPGEFLRMGHSCHPLLSAFSGHSNGDTQQESQTSQRFDPESVP